MTGYWTRTDREARLTRRDEIRPLRRLEFAEAQPRVNFVVHAPLWLPAHHDAGETTLRPEQPPGRPGGIDARELGQTPWSEGNPCSLRTIWRAPQRALRMKQFLYDWAPPAAGIAPLWNTPALSARACGEAVGFVGTDYLGNHGACIQRERTQIELSVVDGDYRNEELFDLLASLHPAAAEDTAEVRDATWHDLAYWVRYGLPPYRVPYGLWRCSRRRPYERKARILRDAFPTELGGVPIPTADDLVPDSAFVTEDEIELYWRIAHRPHDHLILLIDRTGNHSALPCPPEPESQTAAVQERRRMGSRDVHLAGLTTEFGPYECRWHQDEADMALFGSASTYLTADRLLLSTAP